MDFYLKRRLRTLDLEITSNWTEKRPGDEDPMQNRENKTWILSGFVWGEENEIFEREEKRDRLRKVRERERNGL